MKKYLASFFVLLLLLPAAGGKGSQTVITIEPHIGKNAVAVTQTYTLTEEGLTRFELLTISLSYVDLRVYDAQGDLSYSVGENVIVGRNIYRKFTVFFREPISPPYTFTVSYWFPTTATGKPVTGRYLYRIVNVTDTTTVILNIPLTGITETSRASPTPVREEKEDSTTFTYNLSEDTTITLPYETKEGLDYTNMKTETFYYRDYAFVVTYPEKAEVFLEDIKFFVYSVFPLFLEETKIPLEPKKISIELGKEEDTWAGAEYQTGGKIRVFINNTATYPSEFLIHELIHAHIGDFSRYLEEGMATYFEGKIASSYYPPAPESYIPNREAFFQTYERQFGERVDITPSRYGLALTEHQEALIYAKYSKGTSVIYEIARECEHKTVQEMLRTLKEQSTCDLNCLIYQLSNGSEVYRILKKYGFDVVPPYAYPAEKRLKEVSHQSWWSRVLCTLHGFKGTIRAAGPGDVKKITEEIQHVGDTAQKTFLVANGAVFGLVLFFCIIAARKMYQIKRENTKKLYYIYLLPVATALIVFSYFLYEFLFNGYKFKWIFQNVLTPWGFGVLLGTMLVYSLVKVVPENKKVAVEVVWSAFFFGLLVMTAQVYIIRVLLITMGYVVSLAVLFVMRRAE